MALLQPQLRTLSAKVGLLGFAWSEMLANLKVVLVYSDDMENAVIE